MLHNLCKTRFFVNWIRRSLERIFVKLWKGMWDDERIVDLPLPEIWMSGGDACQYTITGPETALEFFDLAQTTQGNNQAAAQIKLKKRLNRWIILYSYERFIHIP